MYKGKEFPLSILRVFHIYHQRTVALCGVLWPLFAGSVQQLQTRITTTFQADLHSKSRFYSLHPNRE